MRSLIVSDVHSKLEPFKSVLLDVEKRGGFDELCSLGDVVGYGPDPGACIDLMMQHDAKGVAGNHDYACNGRMSTEEFNPHAAAAVAWTRKQLEPEQSSYLHDLPLKIELRGFTLVHGSPRDPLMECLITSQVALDNYPLFDTPRCIVGHSHRAFVCRPRGEDAIFEEFPLDAPVALESDRLIINPGSVGQPRDRDSRALRCLRLGRRDDNPPQGRVRCVPDPAQDVRAAASQILGGAYRVRALTQAVPAALS